jgi:hypothetical protein
LMSNTLSTSQQSKWYGLVALRACALLPAISFSRSVPQIAYGIFGLPIRPMAVLV